MARITYDYIRGLTDGEGCFTFCTAGWMGMHKRKIPAFVIAMSKRDKDLLTLVKEKLGLRNKVYEYKPRSGKDGYKRDGMAILMVRDVGQLKNIIIPLFYKSLAGNKSKQLEEWIEKIGADPAVPEPYKFIYKLHKWGYYDSHQKFKDELVYDVYRTHNENTKTSKM